MNPELRTKIKKIIWLLAGICLLALVFMIGSIWGGITLFAKFFPAVSGHVAELGVNAWLAKIIAIPVLLLLFVGAIKIFSLGKNKRRFGYFILASIFSLFCLGMYVKENTSPRIMQIRATPNTTYFRSNGHPLVWCYVRPDGAIDLFNQPGSHPQFGGQLQPITPELVQQILSNLKKEEEKKHEAKPEPPKVAEVAPVNPPEPQKSPESKKPSTPHVPRPPAPKRLNLPAMQVDNNLTPVKAVLQDANGDTIATSEKRVALRELVIVLEQSKK